MLRVHLAVLLLLSVLAVVNASQDAATPGEKKVHGGGGDADRFQPRIPPKWISDDGKSFYLLYSCFPEGPYQFSLQPCVLELNGKRTAAD